MAERFKVIVSNKAREDIKSIIHYLMTTYSHASAVSTVQAINKKIDGLSTFPESNQIFHRRGGELNILYRYTIAKKSHRIIFAVMLKEKEVIVARVSHVKADKSRIVRSLEEE